MIMLSKVLSPFVLLLLLAGASFAQDNPQNPPPNDTRRDVLAQLGLSPEQIQQFRRANQEHRPQMQAAQQRLREANRELDMAIYSDTVSEDVFQAKLRAFQEAQGEVTRLRFQNELAIRRILTPDQVTRFREIRRRFASAIEFMQKGRQQLRDRMQRRNPNNQRKLPPPANPLKQNRRGNE
jgi:Spy/CpxP family protein refolding chaperone